LIESSGIYADIYNRQLKTEDKAAEHTVRFNQENNQ